MSTSNSEPWKDRFPFHAAAQGGNVESLVKLMDSDGVNDKDEDGWTALHYAAWYGHCDCVAKLIEAGADANSRTDDRNATPLHFAAGVGQLDVIPLLLSAGADPTNVDCERQTPLALCQALAPERCNDIVALLESTKQ